MIDLACLLGIQCRVEPSSGDPFRVEGIHLVLHQRNQWRDD